VHELIAWCGFFGAWFLVAGPVYQAALELEEEGLERDTFAPRSPGWWVLRRGCRPGGG
jgi:hypothetical protein